MNIFVLSRDPHEAAIFQCDKHVVKMLLESAQILSTISGGPYKPTHQNHPCVLWASQSTNNYNWLVEHAIELCIEYKFRYGKIHKSESIIRELAHPPSFISDGSSEFVQCMPKEFCGEDPIEAYRRYYKTKSFAVWNRGRPPPYWMDK